MKDFLSRIADPVCLKSDKLGSEKYLENTSEKADTNLEIARLGCSGSLTCRPSLSVKGTDRLSAPQHVSK